MSPASSGGRGARGGTPRRGLALPGPAGEWAKKRCPNAQLAQRRSLSRAPALPAPGRDRTQAFHATGDKMEAVGVSPHLQVKLPLTRYRGKISGRIGDTKPLTWGEKKDVSEKISSEPAPSWRSARRRRFYGIYQPVSLRNCAVLWGTVRGGSDTEWEGQVHVACWAHVTKAAVHTLIGVALPPVMMTLVLTSPASLTALLARSLHLTSPVIQAKSQPLGQAFAQNHQTTIPRIPKPAAPCV